MLIPDENTLKEAAEIEILNSKGEGIKFGSLFEKDKTVVVFIRECSIFFTKYTPLIIATQDISSVVYVPLFGRLLVNSSSIFFQACQVC